MTAYVLDFLRASYVWFGTSRASLRKGTGPMLITGVAVLSERSVDLRTLYRPSLGASISRRNLAATLLTQLRSLWVFRMSLRRHPLRCRVGGQAHNEDCDNFH